MTNNERHPSESFAWDRILITTLTVLFGLTVFFAQDIYASMRSEIKRTQEEVEASNNRINDNAVKIVQVKTEEDAHFQEILRRLDILRDTVRNERNERR